MNTTTTGTALVVYESMFGNTKQVAEAIADGLRSSLEVTLMEVHKAPAEPESTLNLVVAGGPTHAFSMTRTSTRASAIDQGADRAEKDVGLREWISRQPTHRTGVPLATFDTRVASMRHLPGSAAKSAARAARRHGYDTALGTESFYVHDVDGPLLDGELERAVTWGRHLGDMIAAGVSVVRRSPAQ